MLLLCWFFFSWGFLIHSNLSFNVHDNSSEFLSEQHQTQEWYWYICKGLRGVIKRELDMSLRTGLTRIRHNFFRIRNKNMSFILCWFQNRNAKHSFCKCGTNLWSWHRTKFMFVSLIPRKLCSSIRFWTRISFSLYDPPHRPGLTKHSVQIASGPVCIVQQTDSKP